MSSASEIDEVSKVWQPIIPQTNASTRIDSLERKGRSICCNGLLKLRKNFGLRALCVAQPSLTVQVVDRGTVLQDTFKTTQTVYESVLLRVINSTKPYPNPGRPLRNITARCLKLLYSRGETRTLFDTLQALLKIVGEVKVHDRDSNKMCVVPCCRKR